MSFLRNSTTRNRSKPLPTIIWYGPCHMVYIISRLPGDIDLPCEIDRRRCWWSLGNHRVWHLLNQILVLWIFESCFYRTRLMPFSKWLNYLLLACNVTLICGGSWPKIPKGQKIWLKRTMITLRFLCLNDLQSGTSCEHE